ncbi:MAG: TldD/PmbA family protein [Bacteroidales bacterium]|nr:TldD/PmbA family protein [Bacteroidales bacterium]
MFTKHDIPWSISEKEASLVKEYLDKALACGADAARINLAKSMMNLVSLRDGVPDKVTSSGDIMLSISIFRKGRFASFTTNRLDPEAMGPFIREAVDTVDMFEADPLRKLPEPRRLCTTALTGLEMGLYDDAYAAVTPEWRMETATKASCFSKPHGGDYKVISEETEYSDSVSDLIIADSNGLDVRHIESSFEIGCEYTIADRQGHKYSGYWWDAAIRPSDIDFASICPEALRKAESQIGSTTVPGGKYTMVVDTEVAAKMVAPILGALGGYSLQQNNSFLTGSLSKKVFSEGFTMMDLPVSPGECGAKLFDSEGVATANDAVICDGRIDKYFLNTYMAAKMGMAPTVDDCTRAKVMPWWGLGGSRENITADDIMSACGEGILVTGFNGGNFNKVSGDFSYGIEGFAFKGRVLTPVHGMVVTGNITQLWNNLLAAGSDSRACRIKQIPTLAFGNVDFSA